VSAIGDGIDHAAEIRVLLSAEIAALTYLLRPYAWKFKSSLYAEQFQCHGPVRDMVKFIEIFWGSIQKIDR